MAITNTRKKPRHRSHTLIPEVRHRTVEVRSAEVGDNSIVLTGVPINWGHEYSVRDMFGTFTEVIRAGAVDDILERQADVRLLLNHDGLPLARTTSGTLTLESREDGLHMEARLDSRQQIAKDLSVAVERGDLTGMSIGMIIAEDEWNEDMDHRSISKLADLLDVSCVTYPANDMSNVAIAKRMALQTPLESAARLRQLTIDLRAGKDISEGSQQRIIDAVTLLQTTLDDSNIDLSQFRAVEPDVEAEGEPQAPVAAPEDLGKKIAQKRKLELELELMRLRRVA